MKKEIPNPYPEQECFFCGEKNPIGLQLKFYLDEETGVVTTEYVPSRLFMGLGNILHGGIQCGLFDEIMGWTTHILTGEMGVTSEISIHFLKPAYLGKKLIISCRIISRQNAKVQLESKIETAEGVVCARATGTYFLLPQDRFEKLVYGQEQRLHITIE
jgi:uncharacterized protein (TIGR00369 family)